MEARTLGRYRIIEEIGRGAMGMVYRAMDPLIERELAIKTLLPDLSEEIVAEVRERFVREARSAGKLSHPNIVTVFDVGEQDGVAYIAMELLPGRSLQQILRDPEPLPFDTAAEIAAQVADALEHAHTHSIVHRDVKPANVVVAPTGRAKLTDFGIAWVPSSSMTQAGAALGSPKYMSPEQVTGQPVEPRSDVFSLGVLLYEMLARRSPFAREGDVSPFDVMDRIAQEPHPPVRGIKPEVPAALEQIIDRALAKKPEDRYASAAEMAGALRGYLGGKKETAEAPKPDPAAIDALMRLAAQYFGEFAKRLSSIKPTSEAPYEFLYIGSLPAVTLGLAELEDREKHVVLRYRVTPRTPKTVTLAGEEIARCEEYLKNLKVEFQARDGEFTVTGSLPSEINLRADYEAGAIGVELINVRRFGPVEGSIPADRFKDAIEPLARYILGEHDRFGELLKKPTAA
jgi:serine/threonine protein kinase